MTAAGLPAGLRRLLDADAVLPPAAAASWLRNAEAVAVIAPPSVDAVAAVLGYCSEHGIAVLPAGAGTWLRDPLLGRTGAPLPIILSTIRLTGVLEHEPADLVIGLRAGTPLEAVAEHLRAHDQMLPLDPPAASGATIGATIALGAAGPLRAAHGAPRDMVLGLEVVTGDGRVLRFGGRVVKNVAGYDGVRLFTGSRGTLGIITAAYVRVRGMPDVDVTAALSAADAGDPGEAAVLARRVADDIDVAAVEVLSAPADDGPTVRWQVLVRLAGSRQAVAAEEERLAALGASVLTLAPEEATATWLRASRSETAADAHIRLLVRPASLPHALPALAGILRSDNALRHRWQIAAHAADGVVRAWRSTGGTEHGNTHGTSDSAGHDLWEALRRLALSCDGTVTCTFPGTFGSRTAEPAAAGRQAAVLVSRRLVAAFDPAAILRPGAAVRETPAPVEEV